MTSPSSTYRYPACRPAQQRLGESRSARKLIVTDVLTWRPERTFRVWHDRAVFHFMTEEHDRRQYPTTLNAATTPGSVAVFATFAADGPEQCSGLLVSRYSASELAGLLSAEWSPISDDTGGAHDSWRGRSSPSHGQRFAVSQPASVG